MTTCEAPPSAGRRAAARPLNPGSGWETRYSRTVVLADCAAALLAGAVAYGLRPGADRGVWGGATYLTVTALVPVVWVAVLALVGGADQRHQGSGRSDSRVVLGSTATLLAVVAALTWARPVQVPRDYALLTLVATGALTLAGRAWCRRALRSRRRRGACVHRILAVGQAAAVQALVESLRRDDEPGAVVVGCCLPAATPESAGPRDAPRRIAVTVRLSGSARANGAAAANGSGAANGALAVNGGGAGRNGAVAANGAPARTALLPVPVYGGVGDVVGALEATGADTVAVLPCAELEGRVLRRLSWALEGRARHLVVVPGLAEVASARLSVRPISGLPVLHVRHPRLSGAGWVVKSVVDRGLALVALVLLAPVLAGIAILIRATSRGPALFRQTRVGIHGREFTFLKFRTMQVDAEQRRDELAARNINADGVLFKVPDDPRVTPVGAFLRRWSLDELPQLLNVLMGQMSLVGPRPPLPQEVARYSDEVRRRLLVRPGLTGLWQVSGRSDLSWEDSVRLDLRYVDNWSLALDAAILSRTVPAVLHGAGAY